MIHATRWIGNLSVSGTNTGKLDEASDSDLDLEFLRLAFIEYFYNLIIKQ